MLANGTATEIQLEQLRHRLANFIVACASRGEFEPEKLGETALRAFLPKSSKTPGEMAEAFCGIELGQRDFIGTIEPSLAEHDAG